MKYVLKQFIAMLVLVLAFAMVIPQSFVSAGDDITGHYFENEIRQLEALKIMEGDGKGTFYPDAQISRAEFAALVVRSLNLDTAQVASNTFSSAAVTASEIVFSDVPSGKWFYEPVYSAVELGIVKGYGDLFMPEKKISREEMAMMMIRALDTKAIISEPATITYDDEDQIQAIFLDAVKRLANLEIMKGKGENKFAPKDATKRGEAAAVLSRMLNIISPPPSLDYSVATLDSNGEPTIIKEYETFNEAKASLVDQQVIMQGNAIAYMKAGMAVTNKFTIIHNNAQLSDSGRTYIPTGTELMYFDSNEESVEIQLGNNKGFVSRDNVNLIPTSLIKGRSFYTVANGELSHSIFNPMTNKYTTVNAIAKAPVFLQPGTQYHSWNGTHFYQTNGTFAGESYQYFQHLPLHSQSTYTAEELDRFLLEKYPDTFKAKFPVSPLAGTGIAFKEVEAEFGVNALYLMAHAIHESAWGTSAIAQDKKNLFGMKAVDGNAYESAKTYESFKASIQDSASYVAASYHSAKGAYYYGAVLGHKSVGMNVKYASDAYWGELIAAHMYRADQYLGSKEYGLHKIAISNIASLNIRSSYGTTNPIIYEMRISGIPMIYTETSQYNGALWYRIISDSNLNRDGYVYGNGSLGLYVKEIPNLH